MEMESWGGGVLPLWESLEDEGSPAFSHLNVGDGHPPCSGLGEGTASHCRARHGTETQNPASLASVTTFTLLIPFYYCFFTISVCLFENQSERERRYTHSQTAGDLERGRERSPPAGPLSKCQQQLELGRF